MSTWLTQKDQVNQAALRALVSISDFTSIRRLLLGVRSPPSKVRLPFVRSDRDKENVSMAASYSQPSNHLGPNECTDVMPAASAHAAGSSWATARSERVDAKTRLSHLAKTLETDVIPRLVGAHAAGWPLLMPVDAPRVTPSTPAQPPPQASDAQTIEHFVGLLRAGDDRAIHAHITASHEAGQSVASIFLNLFAPSARRLGDMWLADECDFSSVTIALGRLQRALRVWSPAFGSEVHHPPNGRRILLAQHPEEQHSFGLSMVAEFFRREGWEVLGGVGGSVRDPSAQLGKEWFDAIGFSVGSETRLKWLVDRIKRARSASRNESLVVMVGGPLLSVFPNLDSLVGADAASNDGSGAAALVETLMSRWVEARA
jgi:MerR family transcriptional regulator, light-induced transcriptional regulator